MHVVGVFLRNKVPDLCKRKGVRGGPFLQTVQRAEMWGVIAGFVALQSFSSRAPEFHLGVDNLGLFVMSVGCTWEVSLGRYFLICFVAGIFLVALIMLPPYFI